MSDARPTAGPRASIRVRAALAAGVVFGITAGLTVASWTDAEHATTTLTASRFGVQTSLNGAAFSTTTPVVVSATGLYPSASLTSGNRYVSLRVQTTSTPASVGGTVSLAAAANAGGGLAPVLRYRIVENATCTATSFTGSPAWVVGGPAAFQPVNAALAATPGLSLAANAGSTRSFCIELSLPATATQATYQGTSATLTLNVTGTSS